MPAGLSQTDRRLLLFTGGSLLTLAVATVIVAPPAAHQQSAVPSTYSSVRGGARAAYLLLQQLNYPVRRWEEPPTALSDGNAILILAEPSIPPLPEERRTLARFVSEGGRVLFCGGSVSSYFDGANVRSSFSAGWTPASAAAPSPFTRGAPVVEMRPAAQWTKLNAEQLPLYGEAENPDVVLWHAGKGEILWWAAASPLTNAGLPRSNNLRFLLNAVSSRTIYWDEYFHGARASLWSYIDATPVKWAIVQVALLLAAVLFTYSRRSGPVAMPPAPSRLSPLEFVDTLGGLYRRARAYKVAIHVPYLQLRSSLERRLHLPSGTADDILAQAAAERLGWDHAAIASALQTANQAPSSKIKASQALTMVRTIEQFTSKLEKF